ncbi:hypothetical protein [Methylobacterium frigidaeris]|uniref:hypothetical protein n=1 Tax=Methylobacterium frigidaeris TaxID=2038277 RepID=UPI000C1A0096|nr:hypothetical protein [Methylobacterium frigidaeris]PIK74036.1 hypothetical protein CS379_04805 [Methylobacterium frigidaeris]
MTRRRPSPSRASPRLAFRAPGIDGESDPRTGLDEPLTRGEALAEQSGRPEDRLGHGSRGTSGMSIVV